jgi:hypothetical protein
VQSWTVLFWLAFMSQASAEVTDAPLLSDGSVDVAAVLSSFSVIEPEYDTGTGNQLEGSILGKPFSATYEDASGTEYFDLVVIASEITEHVAYLAAVLLNDIICLKQGRGTTVLEWRETSLKIDNGWKVQASCSGEPQVP